jgi:hypothetical protein
MAEAVIEHKQKKKNRILSLNDARIPSSPHPTSKQAGAEIRRSRPVCKRPTVLFF